MSTSRRTRSPTHTSRRAASCSAADAREAVAAEPPQTRTGRFKVTEQGEVSGARYGLPPLARRNLELAVTSVVAGIAQPPPAVPAEWYALLDRLASAAQQSYTALVDDPEFRRFFALCTPVDEIGDTQISSRPRRRGERRSIDDLRAIPWANPYQPGSMPRVWAHPKYARELVADAALRDRFVPRIAAELLATYRHRLGMLAPVDEQAQTVLFVAA